MTKKTVPDPTKDLADRVLEHFATLRVPIRRDDLDQTLAKAERERLSHLECIDLLIADQAGRRRDRSIERRILAAHFDERKTLEAFDWDFNKKAIDRLQFETLATGDFVRRQENLVMVGRSGVGKSHLIQAIGLRACALGFRVLYATSGGLLCDLTASLADQSLLERLRRYANPDLLIIDAFGFDKIERDQCAQASNLFYKVLEARTRKRSTALITNVDFDGWSDYLGDPPLAMAFLDRLVDGAIVIKVPKSARSYRAHRAKIQPQAADSEA